MRTRQIGPFCTGDKTVGPLPIETNYALLGGLTRFQTGTVDNRRAAAKLLTKDEARRIACDDGGSRKDKWAEHRVGPLGGIKIAML